MSLIKITLVLCALVGASVGSANLTTCSNSTGSLRYVYSRPVYGNPPANGRGTHGSEQWIEARANGAVQTFDADAYAFDLASKKILSTTSHGQFGGTSVYAIEVKKAAQNSASAFLICTASWSRPI